MKQLARIYQRTIDLALMRPKSVRHIDWLRKSVELRGEVERGIWLHVEGGHAYKGDLRELVRKGWLEMVRVDLGTTRSHNPKSRSVLFITDEGRQVLKEAEGKRK